MGNIEIEKTQTHKPIEYVSAAIAAFAAIALVIFLLAVLVSFKFTSPKSFADGMGNAVFIFLVSLFLLIAVAALIAARFGKYKHVILKEDENLAKLATRMRTAQVAQAEQVPETAKLIVTRALDMGLPVGYSPSGKVTVTPLYPNLHSFSDGSSIPQLPPLGEKRSLHIPSFAEAMEYGDIGPDQTDMLFCYELVADAQTLQPIELSPVRGEMGMLHTQFVAGGSQSGKTTYMSGIIGQAAAMHTLFYIIDPHKNHPEKSMAAKVQAFSSYFILPPASNHDEIAALLSHATKTRDRLIQGQETPYQGYHIMVIVDEVPALMAYQKSQDKRIKGLYVSLALFMQSIGTQTAKFGMTGLYGSQFVTKDELGDIEIRDACMSQLLLRLHPTQAQAMRILGKSAIQEIPRLDKGHGFLMLSSSFEPIRVASGNVTQNDLTNLARQLPRVSPFDHSQGETEQDTRSGSGSTMKYLAPHLEGDLRKVYEACKLIEQSGEHISSRRIEAITHINRDKANTLIKQLAMQGLIVRRSTD